MIATAVRIYHVVVGDVVLSAAVAEVGEPFVGEVVCLGHNLLDGVWATVEDVDGGGVYCRALAEGAFAEETAIKTLLEYGYVKTYTAKTGKWEKVG